MLPDDLLTLAFLELCENRIKSNDMACFIIKTGDWIVNESILFHQTGMDPYYKVWHTSGRNMIIYMHSDGGSIVTAERNYPITKGCLCFIGSDKFHYTLPDDPQAYDRSKTFFSNAVLEKILAALPADLHFDRVFTTTSLVYAQIDSELRAEVEERFAEINRYADDGFYGQAIAFSCWIRLLIDLHKNAAENIASPSDEMQKAIEYINRHISEDMSIDEICAAVHMSKYHFCRKFKKTVGLTVMNYILKTRIISAKSMLQSEALPIGEISERCGFSSMSYFCRVFKENLNCTPLQYRKKNAVSNTGKTAGNEKMKRP